MSRSTSLSAAKKMGATAAIAAGLVAGGVGVASAASTSASQPAQHGSLPHGVGRPDGGGGPGGFRHGGDEGTVTAASSSSITISKLGGTSSTFAITSSTTVHKDGATASLSELSTGDTVRIEPSSTSSTTASEIDIDSPHLFGTVTSVSGSTITISDQDGFWRTITTSGSTTYTKSGASSNAAAVSVGSVISAEGSIASDHTTLDATSITIGLPTPPTGGAGGPGGPSGSYPAPSA